MKNSNEVFPIKTNYKSFFMEYLTLKKPILELMLSHLHKRKITLNPKLLNVFALILYYNYKYRNVEEELRWDLVFDTKTKNLISKELGINNRHLNTYISILRSIKLLSGNKVSEPFIVVPNGGFDLTFKFHFDDNEK